MGVHAQNKHHLFFFLSFDDSNVTSQKNNILSQICTLSWHLAAGFAHALPGLHSFGEFSVKYLFCHSNVQPMVSKMYMTVLKTSNRWNSSQNFSKSASQVITLSLAQISIKFLFLTLLLIKLLSV